MKRLSYLYNNVRHDPVVPELLTKEAHKVHHYDWEDHFYDLAEEQMKYSEITDLWQ